jgi:iron complex transport system substrate-binding protein
MAEINATASSVPNDQRIRVLYIGPPFTKDLLRVIYNPHLCVYNAGGINVAYTSDKISPGVGPWQTVSLEQIAGWEPERTIDLSILQNSNRLEVHDPYNRTGFKETNAAVKGHIFLINPAYTDWGRGFIGASYMAKWFYPDIFKDLDPEAINKKYFEKRLGVPYTGIWAYPIAS